jgi:transcriptional regulator with XRE-family HTH domain
MTAQELEAIREKLGLTQKAMAERLQCEYVGYKRYATGSRVVPRYIARAVFLLEFIFDNGLQKRLEKALA